MVLALGGKGAGGTAVGVLLGVGLAAAGVAGAVLAGASWPWPAAWWLASVAFLLAWCLLALAGFFKSAAGLSVAAVVLAAAC